MSETHSEIKLHALDYWQVLRNRYGIIVLVFSLVFMTAAVLTYIAPRKYVGRVQLEVKELASDIKIFKESAAEREGVTRNFVETQFKIIESYETLRRVVEKFDLEKVWEVNSVQEAVARIRNNLKTEPERGTRIFNLYLYSQDPEEAANLANAIAEAYEERQNEDLKRRMDKSLAVLESEITAQAEKVSKSREKVNQIKAKYGIVDSRSNRASAEYDFRPGDPRDSLVELMEKDVLDVENRTKEIETHINGLSGLSGDELIARAAMLEINDDTVRRLKPQYEDAQIALEGLRASGLGEKHPRVIEEKNHIEQLKRWLDTGVEEIKESLNMELSIEKEKLSKLKETLDSMRGDFIGRGQKYDEYSEARYDYEMNKETLKAMEQKFSAEKVDIVMTRTPIIFHERAEPASSFAKPNVKLNLILGALVGILFGIGIAFFMEYLDTSVKNIEDVEKYLQVPVLAVIPKDVGILHKQSGINPDAEAYRILRTNIEFNKKSAEANSITIVSGSAGEGKSTTLINLAYICAQGGYNTLMIDGDLRRPRLHTFFDINNSVGLTNYLTTDLQLEDVILQTPVDNLYFMPSGILPADAAGILNSRRMSEMIADVKSRFDLILIDSPPILGVSDSSVLCSEVDMAIVVIQHRKLPQDMLLRVKQAIANVGGNLLGAVLNNVDIHSNSQYQYYTSYYTYYSPSNISKMKSEKHREEKKQDSEKQTKKESQLGVPRSDEEKDIY